MLRRSLALLALLAGIGPLTATSCTVIDTSTITNTIQSTIDSVNEQADAWRTALPKLVSQLGDLESQASGDVKTTIVDTVNQASALTNQTLDTASSLAKDTIAFAAITAQCSVAYTFRQSDYFNIPQTAPLSGLRTTVQLVGNAGVGASSTASAAFALGDLPFRTLPPVTISNPDVNHDWTSYQQLVGVRPGDIVTITSAGGCVQTGGHGDTWKRYLNPIAPDAPNLYHGLVAIVPFMTHTHGNPPPGARIQDYVGRPIAVPLDTSSPALWLGYEDSDYSDNGYSGHDNGTENQCVSSSGAWVTIAIQRN